jgi:ribosome recycling factor
VRTGRAHTGLLDHVQVEYYGSPVPINTVANVTLIDARTLGVQAWEKGMAAKVEKAIRDSDLGLNPAAQGDLIRVPMPALTEERRRDLIKVVKGEGEGAKVAVRNLRRDAIATLKDMLKNKECSEDEERRAQDEIQKLTDRYVAEIDKQLSHQGNRVDGHLATRTRSPGWRRCAFRQFDSRRVPTTSAVPRHVAIIMDGNGRWARKRLLPRFAGHHRGVETVRAMVKACLDRGIEYLTLFAFSSENWRRPQEEVSLLMQLFMRALKEEVKKLDRNGVRLRVVGDLSPFEPDLQALIRASEQRTAGNSRLS